MFKANFRHYADVAKWIQYASEKAITYTARARMALHPHENLCYAGGVALNAVCNALLLKQGIAQNLYMQPAAGDNGLAIGCAYYGWQQVLKKEMPGAGNKTVFFGKTYDAGTTEQALAQHDKSACYTWKKSDDVTGEAATYLASGAVVAWYRGGAEFGPRALGHRSILADPRRKDVQSHINKNIKFREDFRPFAPAVPQEEVHTYFRHGWNSPYMILVDEIRDEWRDVLPGIVHVDGTCRVQTVDASWNPAFHALLKAFGQQTGIPVLVNTSFNRRGMPIVETPQEALDFFLSCALDVLVIDDYIIRKTTT
jgi:carbamoyltransferase